MKGEDKSEGDEVIEEVKSNIRNVLEDSFTEVEAMVRIFKEYEYLISDKEKIKIKIESNIHKLAYQ